MRLLYIIIFAVDYYSRGNPILRQRVRASRARSDLDTELYSDIVVKLTTLSDCFGNWQTSVRRLSLLPYLLKKRPRTSLLKWLRSQCPYCSSRSWIPTPNSALITLRNHNRHPRMHHSSWLNLWFEIYFIQKLISQVSLTSVLNKNLLEKLL